MERSRFEVSAEFLLLSFTRVREAAYALTRGDAGWRGKTAREPLIILLSFSLFLFLPFSLVAKAIAIVPPSMLCFSTIERIPER